MGVKLKFSIAFLMMQAVAIMGMLIVWFMLFSPNYSATFSMNTYGEFWFEFIVINLLFIGGVTIWLITLRE